MTIATAPHLIVVAWTATPTVELVREFADANRRLRRRFPEGAAMVNLVLRGAPRFEGEVLKETAALLKEVSPWRSATAHVILVDGFAGAAVRSFLSTLNLLARSSRPVKVSGDIESAVDWLSRTLEGHPSLSWSDAALREALEGLVRAADDGGPQIDTSS